MLLPFYNLSEQPFGVSPDPKYLFQSPSHREALASLYYGIGSNCGFVSLVAEAGMGKTTLLFQLMQHLSQKARVAYLFQTQCDSRSLLRYLLEDLDQETSASSEMVDLHRQLNDVLVRESQLGWPFIVIVDEAQNLDSEVLETIRLLSDFETPSRKLMQIILAGQPALAGRLASPDLVQLRQRISIQASLQRFSAAETSSYIDHRLQVAGGDSSIFSAESRALIASESGGIPRVINNLCFNALSIAYAEKSKIVSPDMVREVIRDLALAPPSPGDRLKTSPISVPLPVEEPLPEDHAPPAIEIPSEDDTQPPRTRDMTFFPTERVPLESFQAAQPVGRSWLDHAWQLAAVLLLLAAFEIYWLSYGELPQQLLHRITSEWSQRQNMGEKQSPSSSAATTPSRTESNRSAQP